MTAHSELERRYRQRLALYPRAYRREHEDEMLAVLMQAAAPDQEFPRLAETVDLVRGALRMRFRLGYPYPGNAARDALAAFSLLAPLLLLGPSLAALALHLVQAGAPPPSQFRTRMPDLFRSYYARVADARGVQAALAGQLAVTAGVLLRLGRLTLIVIAGVLAWWLFAPGYAFQPRGVFSTILLNWYLLEAVALIASRGAGRGLRLLTWKAAAVLAASAVALTLTWVFSLRLVYPSTASSVGPRGIAVAVGTLLLLAAGVTLFSPLGRYVMVLFAAVFYPYGIFLALLLLGPLRAGPAMTFAVLYLPPLAAAATIVILAVRRRNRDLAAGTPGRRARA